MSIFDKLKQDIPLHNPTDQKTTETKLTFTFAALPESLAQMQALPEAVLENPFQTAALTVLALCA